MFKVNTEHSTGVSPQIIGGRFYHRETPPPPRQVSLWRSLRFAFLYLPSVGTKGLHHYTQLEGIIIFIRAPSKEMLLHRAF